jgi:glucokinase
MSTIAVLDVGGTAIKTGAVTLAGGSAAGSDRVIGGVVEGVVGGVVEGVVEGSVVPTRATGTADVILTQLAVATEASLMLAGPDSIGLAIAFPGPFDLRAGAAMIEGLGKFEAIRALALAPEIRARTSIGSRSIQFVRDNEAAGVGEAVAGAGRGFDRCLTVTLGTGLGTCLTDHGNPVATVGDLSIERLALRPTPWGRADDVLSARGLAVRLGVEPDGLRVAVADPARTAAVAEHGHRLGTFLAVVVAELDADVVIVGGGIAAAFERFGSALQEAVGTTPCVPAALGPRGPLLGAALLALPELAPDSPLRLR